MKQLKSCLLMSLAVTLCLVGSCLMLAFGFLFLEPYLAVRHLTRSLCTVTHHVIVPGYVRCTCFSETQDCLSKFPCARVVVGFEVDNGLMYDNVTLYNTLRSYNLLNANFKCSMHQCDPNVDRNILLIEHFLLDHQPGIQISCYHPPHQPDYAILDVIPMTKVVHSMLWPCLLLVSGVVFLFALTCNIQKFKGKKESHPAVHSIPMSAYDYQLMSIEET